jgi:hypothetical protein
MAQMTEAGSQTAEARSGTNYLKSHLREYGMLMALIAIVVFFVVLVRLQVGVDFLVAQNITNLFLQNSYVIIMALGMLLVIVAGHIDLSVGSVAAFTGAVSAVLTINYGQPVWVVVPACPSSAGSSAPPRATGSPTGASPPSSSRWPACWSSRGCAWHCCRASRSGRSRSSSSA